MSDDESDRRHPVGEQNEPRIAAPVFPHNGKSVLQYSEDGLIGPADLLKLRYGPFTSMANRFAHDANIPAWRVHTIREYAIRHFHQKILEGFDAAEARFSCEHEFDSLLKRLFAGES